MSRPDGKRQQPVEDYLSQLGVPLPTTLDEQALWLYNHALTHSSYTYEHKLSSTENYERLEFLGDAALKLIISQYLYERFPYYREGDLTKIRAVIVSDATLTTFARRIDLGSAMLLGPCEARNGGRDKVSNLACAFEALLGALFLDGKMDFANRFIHWLVEDEVTKVDLSKTKDNYKAVLQELSQADGYGLPEYVTVKEEGPPHHRIFFVEAVLNGETLGRGQGNSKKEAQQMAAKMALICLNELSENEDEDLDLNPAEPTT